MACSLILALVSSSACSSSAEREYDGSDEGATAALALPAVVAGGIGLAFLAAGAIAIANPGAVAVDFYTPAIGASQAAAINGHQMANRVLETEGLSVAELNAEVLADAQTVDASVSETDVNTFFIALEVHGSSIATQNWALAKNNAQAQQQLFANIMETNARMFSVVGAATLVAEASTALNNAYLTGNNYAELSAVKAAMVQQHLIPAVNSFGLAMEHLSSSTPFVAMSEDASAPSGEGEMTEGEYGLLSNSHWRAEISKYAAGYGSPPENPCDENSWGGSDYTEKLIEAFCEPCDVEAQAGITGWYNGQRYCADMDPEDEFGSSNMEQFYNRRGSDLLSRWARTNARESNIQRGITNATSAIEQETAKLVETPADSAQILGRMKTASENLARFSEMMTRLFAGG